MSDILATYEGISARVAKYTVGMR